MASNTIGMGPIEYEIILQAIEAIKSLQQLTAEATSYDQRISMAANATVEFAKKTGVSLSSALSILKEVDAQVAGLNLRQIEQAKGGPLVLNDIKRAYEDLFSQATQGGEAGAEALDKLNQKSSLFGKLGKQAFSDVGQAIKNAENNIGGFAKGIDVARLALGTFVAVGVFQVMQFLSQFFSSAIQQARDLELAFYNIANAERAMSEQGIDIAPKDLEETIAKIKKQLPIFTMQEITTGVANLGLFARELGLTKEQVDQLAMATGILAVRNHITYSQAESQLTTALLSGTTKGIRDLNVEMDDNSVKQRGIAMGFRLVNGELTLHDKKLVETIMIIENANKDMDNMGKYLETNDSKLKQASANWKDFGSNLGQVLLPFLAGLADAGNWLIEHVLTPLLSKAKESISKVMELFLVAEIEIRTFLSKHRALTLNELSEVIKAVKEKVGGMFDVQPAADTATKSLNDFAKALEFVKSQDMNLDSLIKDVQSFTSRLEELNRKFQQGLERDTQDFNTKLSRAQEDYQLDVQRTIEDFNNRRHQLEQQYRNNEKNAEARFQEQLRELREKYLFDLEDALRQRDARQVIRLMEQYKMDKDNLTAKYKLEESERKKQYRQELADLKRQEAQKLAQMAQAEKIKEQRMIEDFNIERARKLQDYLQQQADLKKAWEDRLQTEAQKLAEQFGLNETQTKALYDLLRKYYGPQGFIDGLYDYSYKSLVGRSQNLLTALQTMIAQYISLMNSANALLGGGISSGGGGGTKMRAKGGIDIVNAPTTTSYGAVYGEAGPEAHIFLPLGKSVPSVQNLASSIPSLEGGRMSIELLLSPDLEARIIGNTMGRTADVIMRTLRSK